MQCGAAIYEIIVGCFAERRCHWSLICQILAFLRSLILHLYCDISWTIVCYCPRRFQLRPQIPKGQPDLFGTGEIFEHVGLDISSSVSVKLAIARRQPILLPPPQPAHSQIIQSASMQHASNYKHTPIMSAVRVAACTGLMSFLLQQLRSAAH